MTAKTWLVGLCRLCRKPDQSVIFIRPVAVNGVTAPGFACAGCCHWSRRYVRAYAQQLDARPVS